MKGQFQRPNTWSIPEKKFELENCGNTSILYANIEEFKMDHDESLGEPASKQYTADIFIVNNPITYSSIVSAVVRDKFSADDVEAILLNADDTEEHKKKHEELNEQRAYAKGIAKVVTSK